MSAPNNNNSVSIPGYTHPNGTVVPPYERRTSRPTKMLAWTPGEHVTGFGGKGERFGEPRDLLEIIEDMCDMIQNIPTSYGLKALRNYALTELERANNVQYAWASTSLYAGAFEYIFACEEPLSSMFDILEKLLAKVQSLPKLTWLKKNALRMLEIAKSVKNRPPRAEREGACGGVLPDHDYSSAHVSLGPARKTTQGPPTVARQVREVTPEMACRKCGYVFAYKSGLVTHERKKVCTLRAIRKEASRGGRNAVATANAAVAAANAAVAAANAAVAAANAAAAAASFV